MTLSERAVLGSRPGSARRHTVSPRRRRRGEASDERRSGETPQHTADRVASPAGRVEAETPPDASTSREAHQLGAPLAAGQIALAELDVSNLRPGAGHQVDPHEVLAAVAAAVVRTVDRRRDLIDGETPELVVAGRWIDEARHLTSAGIRRRIAAPASDRRRPEGPWLNLEPALGPSVTHWSTPIQRHCVLDIKLGAPVTRPMVSDRERGPVIEFVSLVPLTVSAPDVSTPLSLLIDGVAALLHDTSWVSQLLEP